MSDHESNADRYSSNPWPHRLAWLLVCATFVLLYLGGSVTTYSAGMAVPDWPTTKGAWFYSIREWLGGDWYVFLEHGHRLLAQGVGLMAIALAVALWTLDRRKWMRWLAVGVVAGVVFQGTLGGLRVLASQLWLAKVHGCTAPLFFGLCAAVVVLTSRRWLQSDPPRQKPAAPALHGLTLGLTTALYVQIVLGAQLRHTSPAGGPLWFQLWVWSKLILAALIAIGVASLVVIVLRTLRTETAIVRRTLLLLFLFVVQLVLGAGTWVTNFGWPLWFQDYIWPLAYTVVAEGSLQVVTTTAHAALGSLNLVVALSLALWSRRVLRGVSR